MTKRVGMIGTGNMGNPMCRNMLKAGLNVRVFDVDPSRVEALREFGATGAGSIAELVQQVDYVMLSLPELRIIEQVVLGEGGVLAASRTGLTVIDTCTSIPELTKRLAQAAAARGVRYVDAPLSGTTPAAEAGTLVVMAGGDADVVEDCKPIYDAIGSKTVHCGPTGNGHAMKLVINSVLLVTQLAGYEGMALGVKLGLDADQIYDVLRSGAADSYINRFKLDKALRRDFSTAGSVGICIKDLDLANAMARGAYIPLLLAPIAQQSYMAAKQAGLNEEDSAAVIKVYEQMLHIEVKGKGAQQ